MRTVLELAVLQGLLLSMHLHCGVRCVRVLRGHCQHDAARRGVAQAMCLASVLQHYGLHLHCSVPRLALSMLQSPHLTAPLAQLQLGHGARCASVLQRSWDLLAAQLNLLPAVQLSDHWQAPSGRTSMCLEESRAESAVLQHLARPAVE